MEIGITCDANWEVKIDKVLDALSDTNYDRFFQKKYYGDSINEIFIVLMCRDSELNFKQRIRQSKKEKILYMDLMLDFDEFMKINQKQRNKITADKIINEVPPIIKKYKFKDFDLEKFEIDLEKVFRKVK